MSSVDEEFPGRVRRASVSISSNFDFLSGLPWLVVSVDSLTYLYGVVAATGNEDQISQTLPLTAVLSAPYLLMRLTNLKLQRASFSVAAHIAFAWLTMAIIALMHVGFGEVANYEIDAALRWETGIRQGVSMLFGLSTLLMFQDSLNRIGRESAFKIALVGALPSLLASLYQIVTGAGRVTGLSSEPSHYADYLIYLIIPATYAALNSSGLRWAVLIGWSALLLLTFSTTGYLKALFGLIALNVKRRRATRGLIYASVLVSLLGFYLYLFPDNYVVATFSYLSSQYNSTGIVSGGTFVDRWYGFVGPLSNFSSLHGFLGYGFGGDTVYFDSIFDPEISRQIREVKGLYASLSSLQGKMLLYGGCLGYFLYIRGWKIAWNSIRNERSDRASDYIAIVMLPTVFVGSIFSLGATFMPYTWMWLAIATAGHRYRINKSGLTPHYAGA